MSQFPFSTERSNLLGTEAFRNLLGESLRSANSSVTILSAYIKVVGIEWLKEQLKGKSVNCIVIARWEKGDLAQGSSDLECYTLAKENKWKFKILKDLHAKVMLVDDKDLFIGSPNLTGSGMSLVPVANKELGIKVQVNNNDIHIVSSLIEEATEVDDQIFDDLSRWKDSLPEIKKQTYPDFPDSVKQKISESYERIWVHNFPWSSPDELLNIKVLNENIIHDLELFGLTKQAISREILESAFENSKIFKWLLNKIKKTENKEIYFGNLSSVIHNDLIDNPKPYRKSVKIFQSNLFKFIKYFNFEHLKIDIPGAKSERIYLND